MLSSLSLCIFFIAEDTEEYKQLMRVNEQCRDLLHYVNEEVREQENWRKADYINKRLDRRPIEGYNFTVLIEFKVGNTRSNLYVI